MTGGDPLHTNDSAPPGPAAPEDEMRRRPGLRPIVVAIDETHYAFEHPEYGKQIEAFLADLADRGRPAGVSVAGDFEAVRTVAVRMPDVPRETAERLIREASADLYRRYARLAALRVPPVRSGDAALVLGPDAPQDTVREVGR